MDTVNKNTNKPLSFKFTLESPIDKKIDYEVMGNALDNILLKAKELNMPLDVEGKIYTVDFSVGSKNKYTATLIIHKKYIDYKVVYKGEMSDKEARSLRQVSNPNYMSPKEKEYFKSVKKEYKDYVKNKKINDNKNKAGGNIRGFNKESTKLKPEDVIDIYYSKEKTSVLASKYNIGNASIYSIRKGKNWAWLTKGYEEGVYNKDGTEKN